MQALYPGVGFMLPYRIAFGYLIFGASCTVVSSLVAYLRTRSVLARQRANATTSSTSTSTSSAPSATVS
jgi:hypothetical protein